MSSERLNRARAFEDEYPVSADRPAFHLAAHVGWMNDPNGFSYYKGQYHLFYQYNPYDRRWGPMHWGHAVSDDLLTWKLLPAALAPDMPYDDREGCFSGSAVELADGRQLLMYTGVGARRGHEHETVQTQCLAVGDGLDYEKIAQNPVLDEHDLPEGADIHDFRDPKVWRIEDGTYRAVVASRAEDGSGQILLYESEDGLNWRYKHVLARNRHRYGVMWECPDFFELDGRAVLLVSPQDMEGADGRFHSGSGNICIIGSFDRETETFEEESVQVIDDGVDFYAMQTLPAPDGRRIMIAWMQNWDTQETAPGADWIGQMTLPREIRIRNGRLYQSPVRELASLHAGAVSCKDVPLEGTVCLEGVRGRFADIDVTVRPAADGIYKNFTMTVAGDGAHGTTIAFEPESGRLTIDRSLSGTRRAYAHRRSCLLEGRDGNLHLRVILDRNSVEVFAGEGEKTLTMTLMTDARADGVSFAACGKAVMDVAFHALACSAAEQG